MKIILTGGLNLQMSIVFSERKYIDLMDIIVFIVLLICCEDNFDGRTEFSNVDRLF